MYPPHRGPQQGSQPPPQALEHSQQISLPNFQAPQYPQHTMQYVRQGLQQTSNQYQAGGQSEGYYQNYSAELCTNQQQSHIQQQLVQLQTKVDFMEASGIPRQLKFQLAQYVLLKNILILTIMTITRKKTMGMIILMTTTLLDLDM